MTDYTDAYSTSLDAARSLLAKVSRDLSDVRPDNVTSDRLYDANQELQDAVTLLDMVANRMVRNEPD